MNKRIFNVAKTQELISPNLELGTLSNDKILIKHHNAVAEVQEQSHTIVVAEYPNGGKDIKTVIDTPYSPQKEAYDEYEDIQVYTPYSPSEIVAVKEQRYKSLVESKIRQRYSIADELGVLRQRDTKIAEYSEYNTYCENCKAQARAEVYNTL